MANPAIAALTAQVTKATDVEKSAELLLNGIVDRIAKAVAAAIANGATAEELQPVADLGTALDTESDALAAAVLANTPPPTP